MAEKAIAFAIPAFFLLIAVELLVNRRRGELAYRFQDSIANLSCGIGQQLSGVLLKTVVSVGYLLLWSGC